MQIRSTARKYRFVFAAMTAGAICHSNPSAAIELGLPAACVLGEDCFFQQYPDMDAGPGKTDPFCGDVTYDGHNGTDLRILSMKDMERGVAVLAADRGKVLRLRDGEPDRLVRTDADRAAVADRECGNGVIVQHADSYETQYCHLRQGSVAVRPGQDVDHGQKIGEIGASGFAAFPHVHIVVRHDGEEVDPATGRKLSAGCVPSADGSGALFTSNVVRSMNRGDTSLLAFGLAGGVIAHDRLVVDGPPPPATPDDGATVAWAWFANLRAGDRVRIELVGPDGQTLTDHLSEPTDSRKADYSAYSGRRGGPQRGYYIVSVELVRDGQVVLDDTRSVEVK